MKDQIQAQKKPNILFRLLAFLLTVALVLGAVALVVYRDSINLDAFVRYLNYRSLETSQTGEAADFSYGGGSDVRFACLDSGLLLCSSNSICLFSNSGTEYANEVLSLPDPVLVSSGSLGVAYSAGGQQLRAYNSRKQVFSLTLDEGYGFISARPNSSGWLAVTAQAHGYKGSVTVYDASFQKIISLNFSSSFVVDAAVSEQNKTVAAVTLSHSSTAFESRVLFYPVDSDQPTADVSLGDTSVLDLYYAQNTLRALGERSLSLLSADGSTLSTYSFNGQYLKDYALGGTDFSLLLLGKYRAGTSGDLVLVGDTGEALGTLAQTEQILSLSASGRYFSVLTADRLDIYTHDLKLYSSLDGTRNARTVVLRSDGSALLADEENAWLYLPS